MTTREENIKKINAQLEMMSDEELDQVAGGTTSEMADDSRFLNSLNGSCDRYGEYLAKANPINISSAVSK